MAELPIALLIPYPLFRDNICLYITVHKAFLVE